MAGLETMQRPYFGICEYIGSMFLVIAAVSPMILFLEVLNASLAVAVVADALAVGFVLFALIEIFGPICTSYFNPAVCLAMAIIKDISWKEAARHSIFQIFGGLTGIFIAHLMFYDKTMRLFEISTISRNGGSFVGEIIGTFILVLCIISLVHQRSERVSLVVGFLAGGMLLSTSSTMFANPQVTIARMFTFSAAGIRPFDGIVFIIIEFFSAVLAVITWKYSISKCACKIKN